MLRSRISVSMYYNVPSHADQEYVNTGPLYQLTYTLQGSQRLKLDDFQPCFFLMVYRHLKECLLRSGLGIVPRTPTKYGLTNRAIHHEER